jgi:hypothetical protein
MDPELIGRIEYSVSPQLTIPDLNVSDPVQTNSNNYLKVLPDLSGPEKRTQEPSGHSGSEDLSWFYLVPDTLSGILRDLVSFDFEDILTKDQRIIGISLILFILGIISKLFE